MMVERMIFFNQYFDENLSENQVNKFVDDKNKHLKEPLYQCTKIKYAGDLINNEFINIEPFQ